ncbi:MAG: Pyrrolo-quinoline quinone, partial [Frankiales bacterium]|nr:Pyrrolo-quinoline quinone [Frankiales bacterium]
MGRHSSRDHRRPVMGADRSRPVSWSAGSRFSHGKSSRRRVLAGLLAAVLGASGLAAVVTFTATTASADVTTNSADNLRTGWYGNQPKLSPAAVTAADFGQLGSMPVDGQVYGQPLISNNVLLANTELNNIYGFDATTRALKWTRNLGTPFNAQSALSCGDIKPQVGITSTAVVDSSTGTEYLMSKVSSPSVALFLHAVDITTGAERPGWPVQIQGKADNDSTLTFNATNELQRPGLLLMNGVVYAGFSGHCDKKPYQGWVTGVSTATHTITAMWSDEVAPGPVGTDGPGGGIWQSGAGLVSDASGDILISTGNGTPPPTGPATVGQSTLGQTLTRLRVQPDGTLKAVDYFAPYDAASLNDSDSDVGSGGPVVLPSQYFGTAKYPRLAVLIGKQSYIWLMDATNLGGVGQGPNGGDNVIQRIGKLAGGVRGKPGVWPGDGGYVYIATSQSGAGSGRLLAYKYGVDGNGNPSLTNTGKSVDAFGFGSGSPVITSDGTASGSALVWVVRFAPTYDSNQAGAGAVLDVYNAIPGSGSVNAGNMTPIKSFPLGQGTKFSVTAVDNGHVFVGTSDGRVLEFGSPVTAALAGDPVSFPTTTQGAGGTQIATVTAQQTVTVNSVSINNTQFSVGAATPALPVTLTAGQTLSVPVNFSPTQDGQILATLSFGTSAGAVPISVSGTGQTTAPKLIQGSCCVSFGGVVAGGPSATDTVTFSNGGSQDLIINGYDLPTAPFTVSGLPAVGTHLASGQSVTVTFTFAPTDSGVFADQFLIHTNDPTADYQDGIDGSPNAGGVALSGSAGTQGVLRIVPTSLNFGDVPVGTTAIQPFTLTNTGGTDLNINISKDPGGLNGFSAASNLVEGTVIPAGQTVTEQVAFTPTTTGPLTADWAISGDDEGGRQDVNLIGNGVPTTALPTLSVGDLDVNRPATGTVTAQVPVRLSAPSTSPVTVNYTTKDGSATTAGGDYTATSGTLTFPAGSTAQTIPVTINGADPAPSGKTMTVLLS